ncbi:2-dehydro-3-deoxygalactonokinase [Falsiroseomonas selenitidurans]|uniref:2-dehydro-3-deoxygalactonokinase n=1 Tax=Falsiroseomonas selenitidurans TaxID=2716335 RepID=A0ABX1DZF2_9PROT|nr:2-dehydro-3-deoxygalactonokinase [Falsiroseomonas selenitidurans]NKC30287.1 2-dehydro-3-deoxygalactonokinase [Falsiroseomonas selenitidurans]
MIGVDWGTTSLRAYRLGADGRARDRLDRPGGILTVAPGGFPAALQDAIGPWLAAGERHVLLCGMVGSRQGWVEAPYLRCPAGPAEIAAATIAIPFDGAECRLVPGLTTEDAAGIPDVMRGEETKLVALAESLGTALACLPGTHSKWARLEDGRVTGFTTHMTGETFAALSEHTILARTSTDGPDVPEAFARGVDRARQPGGLLHHLFGARTLHLMDRLAQAETRSFLSGLLIGHEIAAAAADARQVHLASAAHLAALYAAALARNGIAVTQHDPDLVAQGLARIGRDLGWV